MLLVYLNIVKESIGFCAIAYNTCMREQGWEVGVVIPTYNRADLLKAALESVLAQSTPPAQIIVVDDGSTDHTTEVVADISAKAAGICDVRILEGKHENRRGEARNRGVAATSTPIVAFLDSDDIWKPERLERQLEIWRRDPHAEYAFCNVQYFNDAGLVGVECLPAGRDFSGNILGDVLEEPRAVSSTLLVKRDAFERVGGFRDIRMNEDYELTLRLAAEYRASYVPEVLVLMREHTGRTSRQGRELPLVDSIEMIEAFMSAHPALPEDTPRKGRDSLANMHYKLAQLYTELGEHKEARTHLMTFVRMRPTDRRTLKAILRLLAP